MFSWSKGDERVAIAQMNSELHNAQLELLSAECATDRLRLRFSADDVSRYGQQEVVRKAVASAAALHEYYGNIARQSGDPGSVHPMRPVALSEEQEARAIDLVRRYLETQRAFYRPRGVPLNAEQHAAMAPFFSSSLLSGIRIVEMTNDRLPDPPFYAEARALGLTGLPEISHMASMTFEDVLVFSAGFAHRRLFHGLVHTVQFKVLGGQRYCELFVRSVLRTRNLASVPLEMHAFSLEAKVAADPKDTFSVEELVGQWVKQGRY